MAVDRHKNERNNVEKTGLNFASFLEIRALYSVSFSDALSSGLVASNVSVFNISSYGGV